MNDFIQLCKVSVMQASPARQHPDTLDGVEFRAVELRIIERNAMSLFLPPFAVKARMVVLAEPPIWNRAICDPLPIHPTVEPMSLAMFLAALAPLDDMLSAQLCRPNP